MYINFNRNPREVTKWEASAYMKDVTLQKKDTNIWT
jgi:hypothetical protein